MDKFFAAGFATLAAAFALILGFTLGAKRPFTEVAFSAFFLAMYLAVTVVFVFLAGRQENQ